MYGKDVDQRLPQRKEPVVVHMTSEGIGSPLRISIVDAQGRKGVGITHSCFSVARRRPLTYASLATAVGQLGDTHFHVGELNVESIQGLNALPGLFISVGDIKAARREAVEALMSFRSTSGIAEADNNSASLALQESMEISWWDNRTTEKDTKALLPKAVFTKIHDQECKLTVLCRTREQTFAAINIPCPKKLSLTFWRFTACKTWSIE